MPRMRKEKRKTRGRFDWMSSAPEEAVLEYALEAAPHIMVSVDPGLDFGVAYWGYTERPSIKGHRMPVPLRVGVYEGLASAAEAWESKLTELVGAYEEVLSLPNIERVVLEMPKAYTKSEGGRAAADSGTLVKLSVGVGILWGLCLQYRIMVVGIEPDQWKGQLDKRMLSARVIRSYYLDGKAGITQPWRSHIWDAVGLGLHYYGRLSF